MEQSKNPAPHNPYIRDRGEQTAEENSAISSHSKPRSIIVVLGKTGYGKSTWTWEYLKHEPRVFCYDPLHDAPNMVWMDGQGLVEWHDAISENVRVVKHRIATDDEQSLDTFGHMAFLRGDCIFAVEEAALVWDQGERIGGWTKNIVFLGRHRNVSLLVTAQRAASIPIALRSQATRLVSFAQTEGDDLRWLQGFFGERVKELSQLPPFQCLDSNRGEISQYGI